MIAAAGLGRKAYGFEIKKPYYMDACNAIKTNVQLDLFNAERKYYQKEVEYEQMEEIRG